MKNLIQILTILLLFQFNSFSQRLVKEDCIGTANDEQIIKTHENDDSTITLIYSTQIPDNFTYRFKVLKLDKQKNIIIRKEIDTLEYFGQSDLESLIHFDTDGSFIISNIKNDFLIYSYYDKNISKIWCTVDTSYNTTFFKGKSNSIAKKQNGGFIIINYENSFYGGGKYLALSISNIGKIEWNYYFEVKNYFSNPYWMSLFNSVIIPKIDGKIFINLGVNNIGVFGGNGFINYSVVLDSLGNKIFEKSFDSLNSNLLNFSFNTDIKYDKLENLSINYSLDSTNYAIVLNTNNLDIIRIDSSKQSGLIKIFMPNVLTDSSNIFYISENYEDTSINFSCKNLNNDSIWSLKIPYVFYGFNTGIYNTIIIDNNTIFYNNTLIRNGIKLWEIPIIENDTINYKGIIAISTGYKIFKSKFNNQFLNMARTYSNNMVRYMTIDINSGNIIQDNFIENISEITNYADYNNNTKETFLASNNYNTCRFGEGDIYLATYSNIYNTIKGIAYIDYNNDSNKQNNEPIYPFGFVKTISVGDTQTQHLNATTPFNFFVNNGSYNTSLQLYNNYYTIAPPQFTTSHNNYGNNDTLLFALKPIPNKNDMYLNLVNNWMTRLGQANSYTISIENKGTTYGNGKVKVLMDSRLLNITATPTFTYRSGDTLVWNITNQLPAQKVFSTINFIAAIPTILNPSDTIISKAWFVSDSIDITPEDNITEVKELIRASYDPNEKNILSGETLTRAQIDNGAYVSYIIHFENKGNDTAFKVIVIDTLSEMVDINSLQIINASHNYTLEILDKRILKFTFNNIRLSYDSLSTTSKGFIAYKLKPKSDVALGSTINNTANIFFDYNEPIRTNTAQAKILVATAINQNKNSAGIMNIYPNPNNGIFIISYENKTNSKLQLQLIDVTGNVIYQEDKQHHNKTEFSINQNNLAKGIYWIKLTDGNSINSRAIIVQ